MRHYSRRLATRAGDGSRLERPFITATHLFRQVRGRSGSIIGLCEDGKYYLIKLVGNPSGPNALGNEALGCEMASMLNLGVAQTLMVRVPRHLLRSAPTEWFNEYANGRYPESELHLGSLIVGEPQGTSTSDLIGYQQLTSIDNRADFFGMLLLDVLANNQEPRKALFTRPPDRLRLRATFIGNSGMFGGTSCTFDQNKQNGLFFRQDVYKGQWSERTFEWTLYAVMHKLPDLLEDFYRQTPSEWYDSRHAGVGTNLLERLSMLPSLMERFKSWFY